MTSDGTVYPGNPNPFECGRMRNVVYVSSMFVNNENLVLLGLTIALKQYIIRFIGLGRNKTNGLATFNITSLLF
jgi:hypothetical protein